jgi:GT2 family glycosyltransferase
VPAVTAACLMVARDAFAAVGGFDEDYVIANYEDSDLCLRLKAEGHLHWYLPEVRLLHLESASQAGIDGEWLRNAISYNAWLQTHRHDALIRSSMELPER